MKAGQIYHPTWGKTSQNNSQPTTTPTMKNSISFSTIIMIVFFALIALHNLAAQHVAVVYFEQGSSKVSAADAAKLARIEPKSITSIVGYASVEGTKDANGKLSVERAYAVAELFGDIDADVYGKGETTQFGAKANNRKVVIFYTEERSTSSYMPEFDGVDGIDADERLKQATADLGEDTTTMVSIFGEVIPISTGSVTDSLGQGNLSPKDSNISTTPIIVTLRDTVVLTDTVTVRDTIIRNVQVLPEKQAIRFLMAKGKTRAEAVAHLDEQARLGEIVDMQTWEKTKPAKDYKSIKTQPRKKKTTRLKKTKGLSTRGGILNKWFPNRNC